jgi:hypothetical protein
MGTPYIKLLDPTTNHYVQIAIDATTLANTLSILLQNKSGTIALLDDVTAATTGITKLMGTANGIATLGADGKIKPSELPTTVAGYGITDVYTKNDVYTKADVYTKTEITNIIQGFNPKQSVKVATTGNITLSGTQTIDGIAVAVGDRVLVKNQTTGSQNGIYVVSATNWTRSTDTDIASELTSAFCFVERGLIYKDTGWVCTTDDIVLGTTSITFVQFSGAGSYQPVNVNLSALSGLSLTADQLPYATGQGTMSLTTLTQFARKLLSQPDAPSVLSAIGGANTNTATQTAAGLMSSTDKAKLDGIAANANNYTLPTATTTVLGGVKASTFGSSLLTQPDAGSVLSAIGGAGKTTATQTAAGLMSNTDKSKLDGIAANANNYVLPAATESALGGVKISVYGSTLYIAT